MSELTTLTAVQMRAGLIRGDFSALELADAHLERIEATNKRFNSFITVTKDAARKAATAADAIIAKEKDASAALCGIPISVKDILVTKGVETTASSKILSGFIPPYDATAVSLTKRAGAAILGKTGHDEFGMGGSNENSAYGNVLNPWDESRVPGGSSGGSAVSVALGQAPLSLGSDTGGSIRQPASFTGTVGLKPTYGRISRYGLIAFASSLDTVGIIARDVDDCALALGVVAGQDESDSTSVEQFVPDYLEELASVENQDLKGLRVGVPKEFFVAGMDVDVESTIKDSITVLSKLGAEIVDISLPHSTHANAVYYIVAPAEASSNLSRFDGVRYGYRAPGIGSLAELYEQTRAQGFGAEVKRRILIGTYVLSAGYYDAYYAKAQQVRTLIIQDFHSAFADKCDVILTPTAPSTAFKFGEKTSSPLEMYLSDIFTTPVSLAGLPAINIPAGLDSQSLPVGMQLIGAPFRELDIMRVAKRFLLERPFATAQHAGGAA